jgi:hypothetical protein
MAMSTSGSFDYSLTGAQIIIETLELIGIKGAGDTVSAEDQATCLRTLNTMVKLLHAEGVGLWKTVEASLFPTYEGYSYDIGPSGGHCSTGGYKTEIATAAASGAGTITVDSDDDITDGDYIGIELDDKSVQWTTVDGVPSLDVVSFTGVLTDGAAVDNHVYNYTSKIQRPTEIIESRKVSASGYETSISIISRDEYMRFSDKSSRGSANQIYYDPLRTNGKMYVWPACTDVKEYIKFSCRIAIEDFDSATNDADFPQEWILPLSWQLASLVAPKFGKKLDNLFMAQAAGLFQTAKDFDHENTSIYIKAR